MPRKTYTAQEMREVANAIILPELATVAAMLRQAADAMERMAAKDAEIAKLTADNMRMESLQQKAGETVVGLMNKMSAQHEEIKELRALVSGLADVVSTARPKFCNGCPGALCSIAGEPCGFVSQADELVDRAREVAK